MYVGIKSICVYKGCFYIGDIQEKKNYFKWFSKLGTPEDSILIT